MFGFWKPKAKQPDTRRNSLPPPSALSDDALINMIRQTFEAQNEVVAALFLVAWENFTVYYSLFAQSAEKSKQFPPSLDGMATFLATSYDKGTGNEINDEANRRRLFYFYVATLLRTAHARAKKDPRLWEVIADVWMRLLAGARALRKTLDTTSLWQPDEVEFFRDVQTPLDGENYCLTLMVPNEIRYHPKIKEWLERDLSPEVRAELKAMDKLFDDDK